MRMKSLISVGLWLAFIGHVHSVTSASSTTSTFAISSVSPSSQSSSSTVVSSASSSTTSTVSSARSTSTPSSAPTVLQSSTSSTVISSSPSSTSQSSISSSTQTLPASQSSSTPSSSTTSGLSTSSSLSTSPAPPSSSPTTSTNNVSSTTSRPSTTSTSPTTTQSSTTSQAPLTNCNASCIALEHIATFRWLQQQVTTTLTAATIIYIVNNRTNTTRTVTSFNKLPDGYTLPPTNERGTQTAIAELFTANGKATKVTLAYPTGLTLYPYNYEWSGILPTLDAMGKSVCSTAEERQNVTYATAPAVPILIEPAKITDAADSKGLEYKLTRWGCSGPPQKELTGNDAAPKLCDSPPACPASILPTAAFLTQESTSFDSSDPTPAPEPPKNNGNPHSAQPVQDPAVDTGRSGSSNEANDGQRTSGDGQSSSNDGQRTSNGNNNGNGVGNDGAQGVNQAGNDLVSVIDNAVNQAAGNQNNVQQGQQSGQTGQGSEQGGQQSGQQPGPQGQQGNTPTPPDTEQSARVAGESGAAANDAPIAAPGQQAVTNAPAPTGSQFSDSLADSVVAPFVVNGVTIKPVPASAQATPGAGSNEPGVLSKPPTDGSSRTDILWAVDGKALTIGSTITIGSGSATTAVGLQVVDGTTQLVVGSVTSQLPSTVQTALPAPVVIAGATITPKPFTDAAGSVGLGFAIGGQSLRTGSTITVGSGSLAKTIALQVSDGRTQVVVNGQTSALTFPAGAGGSALVVQGVYTTKVLSGVVGVGDWIMAGLMGGGLATERGQIRSASGESEGARKANATASSTTAAARSAATSISSGTGVVRMLFIPVWSLITVLFVG